MKKKLLALAMVAGLVLSGCGSSDSDKSGAGKTDSGEKIIVGGLAPLTGKVAIYGITSSNGTKLAFDEINKAGGILGKQVEFKLEDEKGEVVDAKQAYGKLLGEKMDALIGDITSGPTYAVAEDANKDGIPMITPTGTQLNITDGRPNVFRVCFTDPYQGDVLAKYAKENLKVKKAAVMKNTSSDYSNGVADQFAKKAKELGIEVVETVAYGEDDKDFKAQLTKLKEKDPEVILIPDYYQKIALIAPQAKEAGLTAKFIGPDGWDGILQQFEGKADSIKTVEGAVFANHYSKDDQGKKIKGFVDAYKAKYKEDPTAFSALGYDAAYLLKAAMEKAGSTDKAKVSEELRKISYDGVTGKLTFDKNNNPIKEVTMLKIENGKYVFDTAISSK